MIIFPRQITSLRHVWEHPDIPYIIDDIYNLDEMERQRIKAKVIDSMKWLEEYAEKISAHTGSHHRYTVQELLSAAKEFLEDGEYFYGESSFLCPEHMSDFQGKHIPSEFWHHFEIVSNIKVPQDKRENFFSCSC